MARLSVMVFTLMVFGYFPLYANASPTREEISCDDEMLEICAKPLIKLAKLPNTEADSREKLAEICTPIQSAFKCIDAWVYRCSPRLTSIYGGLVDYARDVCTKGPFQEAYLKLGPCMRQVPESEIDKCAINNKINTTSAFLGKEYYEGLCCEIIAFRQCVSDVYTTKCGPEVAKFLSNAVMKVGGPVVQTCLNERDKIDCMEDL